MAYGLRADIITGSCFVEYLLMNIPTTNAQLNTGSSNPGIKWDTVLLMQYPPNAITATMIRLKVSGSMEMEEQELSPMLSRLSPGNRPVCNS